MEIMEIKATKRVVTGKKVKALRRRGELPAVMYGYDQEPIPIALDQRESSRILGGLTQSSLVTIDLEGKKYPTLVRDKQRDYLKDQFLHVDFYVVSLTERIRASVGIELTGSSPAVKELNGIVLTGINEIQVECLPSDLPERITVDISDLDEIGSGIFVRDIEISEDVSVLDDLDSMIASISFADIEEEVEEELEEIVLDEPEVIEKGKKDEEDLEVE